MKINMSNKPACKNVKICNGPAVPAYCFSCVNCFHGSDFYLTGESSLANADGYVSSSFHFLLFSFSTKIIHFLPLLLQITAIAKWTRDIPASSNAVSTVTINCKQMPYSVAQNGSVDPKRNLGGSHMVNKYGPDLHKFEFLIAGMAIRPVRPHFVI